jgi:hypothetical protein
MTKALLVSAALVLMSFAAVPPVSAEVLTGTAFAVSDDGDLLTTADVVSGCTSVEVRFGYRFS